LNHGRWRIRQHAFDDGLLAILLFLAAARHGGGVVRLVGHFVARFDVVKARVIVLEAL
jgi:hypothetical protein